MENNRRLKVLKRRHDFQKLKENGKKLRVRNWLLVNYKENEFDQFRCGWTIPKKVGSAVVRNRLKRWCREFFRQNPNSIQPVDFNLVFIGRNKDFFKNLRHEKFEEIMNQTCQKISVG